VRKDLLKHEHLFCSHHYICQTTAQNTCQLSQRVTYALAEQLVIQCCVCVRLRGLLHITVTHWLAHSVPE